MRESATPWRLALPLIVCGGICAALPARADDASALVKRARRLEADGHLDAAVEIYKAAILLDGSAPEPHRGIAGIRTRQHRCEEAVPEFQAYVQLAPVTIRHGASWDDALASLAACVREIAAVVDVQVNGDARCAADNGVAREAFAGTPLRIELSPGRHEIACASAAGAAGRESVLLQPREHRAIAIALPPPADHPADAGPRFAAADDLPPPPPVEPSPPQAAPPGTSFIELQGESSGWSCSVDHGTTVESGSSTVVEAPVAPGSHVVQCQLGGVLFDQRVQVPAGERVEVRLSFRAPLPQAVGTPPRP